MRSGVVLHLRLRLAERLVLQKYLQMRETRNVTHLHLHMHMIIDCASLKMVSHRYEP